MNKRIKLTVAYDGTCYSGFQIQDNGNTIAAELNRALSKLSGHEVEVAGASRTDAGVHARGQVATFDLRGRISPGQICIAAQGLLPQDIRIIQAEEVPADFHCRYEAKGKHYRYTVDAGPVTDPFQYRYRWHFPRSLDLEKMQEARNHLLGSHDFRAFCASHSGRTNFVRRLDAVDLTLKEDVLTLDFWGNGFLYKMVRSITGYLLDVGRGRFSPDLGKEVLLTGRRQDLGVTAPARGLCLMKIYYKTYPYD